MNTTALHALASDKLYLLAYIKQHGTRLPRQKLLDSILAEGRMNYFFLCQYLSELLDAGFLLEEEGDLVITKDGIDALHMFSDQINSDDVKSLRSEEVRYAVSEKDENILYEKTIRGHVVFSLTVRRDTVDIDTSRPPKEVIERILKHLEEGI
ncbi:MAG: DUF4364 family protein [Peptoniphilus sp.]|nr:DUF4364 family protein [Peptoniphilus sp.]MDD7362534.1 DUF4364 family protein [Bacillota bacterium]MDY6045067.1 DUF4364 family protein [Peptoniphilus sp.]